MGTGCEPSADELIDVLKNLENLAAADPQLYRTIVDQIKGGAMGGFFQQVTSGNGQASQYEQQMYEQQQREAQIYEQQQQQQMQMQMEQQRMYEEQQRMMQQQEESSMQQQQSFSSSSVQQQQQTSSSSSSMRQEVSSSSSSMRQEQSSSVQMQQETKMTKQVTETASSLGMPDEEFKQHSGMKRLEAEAQEEVRQTLAAQREAKMKKLHPPAPPPPKEITVVAGDGKQVKIHGGEKELEDCRRQVAEAAGLKHVALPEFENADGSAWAGSLKKTNKNRPVQEEEEGNPWAGSLRHVDDHRKGKAKKEDKEDTYGNAPWMGTLRHVVHDNKVTRNYGVNQQKSKRYPDEDAGNPYESIGGSNAKPAFPLTPAAIINGSVMSRDEMARREEEEEVARIRSNIGSKTVSTALLQVLMPKLLKMHEAKYEPMEKTDAEKIMEEILSMQAGLNPDQQADANEEAEMIIRAIMQDEVDNLFIPKWLMIWRRHQRELRKGKLKRSKR